MQKELKEFMMRENCVQFSNYKKVCNLGNSTLDVNPNQSTNQKDKQ